MEKSALVEALQSLSAWEIRSARRWVISPMFNARAAAVVLFDFLIEKISKKEADEIKHIDLEQLLATKDAKKIRREMSHLLDLLRDFMAWQELQREPARRALYQLRAARRRGLEKNFHLAEREVVRQHAQIGEATLARHQVSFQLEMEKYEWELARRRGQNFPFEQLTEQLNAWYAGQLMQLACMKHAQSTMHRPAESAADAWVQPLVEALPGAPHRNLPSVALFQLGYEMLQQPELPQPVDDFRELLAQNIEKLPIDEARGLLMLAINHGIRQINASGGERTALARTLNFYLLGLETSLLLDERGHLPKYTYNNVLMTYLAMQSWEQAHVFLEKYREQLLPAEQENVYRYNLAIYHFRRGAFDATLELLRDVHFPDPMYNLESRKMLLKIYFEQENYQSLESLLENLMVWLRRHPEIGYHREMYRNLARFTGRLLRLPPHDADGRKKLKKKVLDTPLVAERAWLLKKIG